MFNEFLIDVCVCVCVHWINRNLSKREKPMIFSLHPIIVSERLDAMQLRSSKAIRIVNKVAPTGYVNPFISL